MMTRFLAGAALSALMIAPAAAQDAGTVLATVNGTEITLGHVIMMQDQLPDQYRQLPDDILLQGILDQLVQQEIIVGQARGNLNTRALTGLENEERSYLAAMIIDQIAQEPISDEELQAEYDAQFASAEPMQEYNASHILVETEEEALALIAELADGADFAELAQTHSTGPSGPNGGQLGWFSAGMMVPSFEEAVFALEVGEVSAPVQTQFGWHVVVLNDSRQLDAPALEDVRADLIEGLRRVRVDTRITEMGEGAEVVHLELDFDPALIRNLDLLDN